MTKLQNSLNHCGTVHLANVDRSEGEVAAWLKNNIDLGYAIAVAEVDGTPIGYGMLGRSDVSYLRHWDGTALCAGSRLTDTVSLNFLIQPR